MSGLHFGWYSWFVCMSLFVRVCHCHHQCYVLNAHVVLLLVLFVYYQFNKVIVIIIQATC